MLSKKIILIFSGFNQRAVIAFIRTLKKNDLKFAIVACSKYDTIFATDYKANIIYTRKSLVLNLDDLLESIRVVKKYFKSEELLIAPSSEALNRFLLKFRLEFEKSGCAIPLVDEKLYTQISDKKSFGQICKKENIVIPQEISLENGLHYPCVAKPKKYFSSKTGESLSPVLIKNKSDFIIFSKSSYVKDFYFQEFIGGQSLYLLYYIYKDGSLNKFSQQNLIQQPNGKSILAAVSTDMHLSSESIKYEKLLRKLKYRGLIMIEIKKLNDNYVMIEANPRFWGPSQLFVDSENNLFEDLLADFGIINKKTRTQINNNELRYFWYGGIQEITKNNGKLVFHNYNIKRFLTEFNDWLKSDIYLRKDTLGIFKKEVLS